MFIEVFSNYIRKLSQKDFYLAQGTLYTDIIESRSFHGGKSVTIKSHHNVGGLPKDLKFDVIEPFRELFKDEVRRLGLFYKLDQKFVSRHPFPGPGLGIRCIGKVNRQRLDTLRDIDEIFINMYKITSLCLISLLLTTILFVQSEWHLDAVNDSIISLSNTDDVVDLFSISLSDDELNDELSAEATAEQGEAVSTEKPLPLTPPSKVPLTLKVEAEKVHMTLEELLQSKNHGNQL